MSKKHWIAIYFLYLVLIRKLYIVCSFRLFWLSIAFWLYHARMSIPLCAPPRFVCCSPLIPIRQMDVMPIILMWTCWKLERNVQISAPFYWKYHRLFTSKTNFTRHSCAQENTTFISTVNFLGYMDCRNWALSFSLPFCVETHTESGKIFALFVPSKISAMCMHHTNDDDCVVAVSVSVSVSMSVCINIETVCNAQQHCAAAACCCCLYVHLSMYDVAIVSGTSYDVLLIKTICRFSEQLPMDVLLLIINRWNYW